MTRRKSFKILELYCFKIVSRVCQAKAKIDHRVQFPFFSFCQIATWLQGDETNQCNGQNTLSRLFYVFFFCFDDHFILHQTDSTPSNGTY